MSTEVVVRPPRSAAPALPRGEIILEPPPELPGELAARRSQLVLLLPTLAGMMAMALVFASRAGGTLTYLAGGVLGLALLGQLFMQMTPQDRDPEAVLAAERQDYLRYLDQVRRQARRAVEQQRVAMRRRHPDPEVLWSFVGSRRMWERRAADEDFGEIRLAVGPQPLAVTLVPPETKPVEDLDPLCAIALRRFVRTYSTVPDLPIALSLRAFGRVVLRGERPDTLALARSLLCSAAVLHAPDDLRVAVVTAPDRLADWDWVKWLPHTHDDRRRDGAGVASLVFPGLAELESALADELQIRPGFSVDAVPLVTEPHLLVIHDGGETDRAESLTKAGLLGTTVLDLSGAVPRDAGRWLLCLRVAGEEIRLDQGKSTTLLGRPDRLSVPQAAAVARQLSRYRLLRPGGSDPLTGDTSLLELLGLDGPGALDPARSWADRPARQRLRVPIGVGRDGQPVELDLKEAALEGMGPHGLVIGATGSGKSELLRTLVIALAATHSSEELNFALIDFKGGATFDSFDRLPHTSAVITNLADELPLVDRTHDALAGELVRRQELLRSAGNYASRHEYERARRSGAPVPPLPSLLIVCDEFSELLTAKPDFIDLFVQIGRVGRSLGVHLLLASQRLEEGRLRGLDTHLSYRIGLRTFSAVESRIVLGVPDAYELPRTPGHGYLRVDTSTMIRFQAAYVSGVYRPTRRVTGVRPAESLVVPFSAGRVPVPGTPLVEDPPDDVEEQLTSVLDLLIDRLYDRGVPAHQVWLPPLAVPPTLADLLPPLAVNATFGLHPIGWPQRGSLVAPVGVVDRPFDQRRDVLLVDLAGASGHLAIVGGPQSGKSTLTRSLICALALTHTPAEAQFFCLNFGGGGLGSLEGLPHVSGVASRRDVDKVQRVAAEVGTLFEEREARFAALGIQNMADYRRRRARGEFADDPFGDVFLVVDDWRTLRAEFEELEDEITQLADRGLSYGIHLVLTAGRWSDIRPALRDLLGTRLELRLGDPTDSQLDRKAAVSVPERTPGRGLTPEKLHFLAAVPHLDTDRFEDSDQASVELVQRVAAAWPGPPAPPVRLLPHRLPVDTLAAMADPARGLAIGIEGDRLAPVYLDLVGHPHFMVFGDAQSGKTNLLRHIARSIVERYSPEQARLVLVDYRRGLLGAVEGPHLLEYATNVKSLTESIGSLRSAMVHRIPAPEVTAEQLRNRSWWLGPDLYLLIDDYDLVAGGGSNPVVEMRDLLPQARDVGLHLIVARRSGGAARALYDPVLQSLRELDTPGLLLAGQREEGALLGNVRPTPQPPGRGRLVTRAAGVQLIQTVWNEP
ncbi:type VII secretion protein EccC [Micromonospora qiuiae]|uniref:Type VII secretion protein EccC n=1 Tax=Micromonospora qiuiae TaxID=502268 RepID=A0ABQ4JHZ1_9ACTN|nr:type VII secretion protein EccCa [Micromonospora qiuiae]GIJ29099.1 type VII secretion protein EccC [Micromonospora qiuiae]